MMGEYKLRDHFELIIKTIMGYRRPYFVEDYPEDTVEKVLISANRLRQAVPEEEFVDVMVAAFTEIESTMQWAA